LEDIAGGSVFHEGFSVKKLKNGMYKVLEDLAKYDKE
jgi:hypothetical protein